MDNKGNETNKTAILSGDSVACYDQNVWLSEASAE